MYLNSSSSFVVVVVVRRRSSSFVVVRRRRWFEFIVFASFLLSVVGCRSSIVGCR
jgi:hypothetical protein